MKQTETVQLVKNADYSAFIRDVKHRIQSAQIKAAVRVNQELLTLYWELGERIIEKQREAQWGEGFLKQMSRDLLGDFPEMKGFSQRNLELIRQWVSFWQQLGAKNVQQPVAQIAKQLVSQIPWGHNILISRKISGLDEALFYVRKTIENNWSRSVLTHHIESEYIITKNLPDEFKSSLPSIEEIEAEVDREFSRK